MVDEPNQTRMVPASEAPLAPVRPVESPNELWEWLRLLNRRKALILGCGLIATALMALMAQDKKVLDGKLRFILARSIGEAFVTDQVPAEIVTGLLAEALARKV